MEWHFMHGSSSLELGAASGSREGVGIGEVVHTVELIMRAEVVGLVPHTSCPRLQRPCGDRELDANSNPPTQRPWTAEESSAGQTTAIHC